ncbi:MAG: NifU family protein [Campylobacterota bacterium]|nr:NifU family protein [Campylobacterota bacterium]
MKDIDYYMSLDYPVEVYPGEHEVGDAYLAIYTDFDIKGASEDYDESIDIAREYLKVHIKKQLELGKEIPNPGEGVRFMSHRVALKAYRAKDYDTALSIWNKEAELKNDQAMANLGLMYLKGEGVDKDFKKAQEWFEKGSSYGNDSANYNLALMYQGAIGIEEDMDKAIFHFREAVKKNHQGASFRLGLLLLKDRTDKTLVKEGFESMLNAAKTGHPMAMVQMGGVDKPANKEAEPNKLFRAKPYKEQLEIIEDAINRYIRPILVKDGGDMMILDYINEPEIEIRLAYQGACAGCSLGATSTYELIRSTLAQVIDDNIQIFII